MKVYIWKVVTHLSDIENVDSEDVVSEVMAPDMSLEMAIKYFEMWAMNQWPEKHIERRIDHIQKLFLFGIIDNEEEK